MTRTVMLAAALAAATTVMLSACTGSQGLSAASGGGDASRTAGASGGVASSIGPEQTPAVSGNECPQVFDASTADFYPIQPSFSAGYTAAAQHLSSDTAHWAYVVTGDFPYSNWMAWYLYNAKGVPLFKLSDKDIAPEQGSTNPYVVGNPILAEPRSYTITFMPASTPGSVITAMQQQGQNVATLPAVGSTADVVIVSRSYWSFGNDGLGDYDRFGYGGPTNTPGPVITAFLTDASTGELTHTPVSDCSSQSALPERVWHNSMTGKPVVTFADAPVPTSQELNDIPHWLMQTGSFSGAMGEEFPPAPAPDQVQFYRNVASNAPFADVQSAPPAGDPPDACGGYVMANLPNDVVSLIHVPQVPSFPSYRGATRSTLNQSNDYDVQFYSIVVYGATKQIDAVGSPANSQIGNSQIAVSRDGSATVVVYPNAATPDQVAQIQRVAEANGWNLLKGGVQTAVAPNLVVVREKGQNAQWKNALSANDVTQGAPCPQSTNPSLPLPQDPPSAQVTQFNGMGLSAPQGQNCTVQGFLSGECLRGFAQQLAAAGARWSAGSAVPPAQLTPS